MRSMMAVALALLAGMAGAQQGPALKTEQQKRSYALGMVIGSQLRGESVEVELDDYVRGLKDALSGKAILTTEEARATLDVLRAELKKRRVAQADGPRNSEAPADPASREVAGITVSFKLDPRLTKGVYMGERWVSPPTYSRVQDGDSLVVHARAAVRDARGSPVQVSATWTPADSEIVAVAPGEGHEVRLTVRRPGATSVTVAHGERSKTLKVYAVEERGHLRVDISG